jgi:hypothetical protein
MLRLVFQFAVHCLDLTNASRWAELCSRVPPSGLKWNFAIASTRWHFSSPRIKYSSEGFTFNLVRLKLMLSSKRLHLRVWQWWCILDRPGLVQLSTIYPFVCRLDYSSWMPPLGLERTESCSAVQLLLHAEERQRRGAGGCTSARRTWCTSTARNTASRSCAPPTAVHAETERAHWLMTDSNKTGQGWMHLFVWKTKHVPVKFYCSSEKTLPLLFVFLRKPLLFTASTKCDFAMNVPFTGAEGDCVV